MATWWPFGKKKMRATTCECGLVIKGSSDQEVMRLAGEHMKQAHNKTMSPQAMEMTQKMIKDA